MGGFVLEGDNKKKSGGFAQEFTGLPFVKEDELNKFAAFSPKLFAAAGTAWSLAVDTLPPLKYSVPQERSNFLRLSTHEQRKQILWDTFGTMLGVGLVGYARLPIGGGVSAKRVVPAVKGAVQTKRLKKAKTFPTEDILSHINARTKNFSVEPFFYQSALKSKVRGLGFGKFEDEAISSMMQTGNRSVLRQAQLERSFKKKNPTNAWKKYIRPTREAYGGFRPTKELMQELSEETLKNRHWQSQYNKTLSKEIFGTGFPTKDFPKKVLRERVRVLHGDEFAKNLDPGDVDPKMFQELILDSLRHKKKIATYIKPGTGRRMPLGTMPSRILFGTGERMFGTHTYVYKPTKAATEATSKEIFGQTLTWHSMLRERGIGELKFDKFGKYEFIPKFTKQEADDAYRILRVRDEIQMKVTREKMTVEEGQEAIKQAFNNTNLTNSVRELIHSWDDFADTLYGDYMFDKIGKVLKAASLSEHGHRAVDTMMMRLHPRIAEVFSTYGSKSVTDKFTEVKSILKEVRGKLAVEKGVKHPWFSGEARDQVGVLDKLRKELTTHQEKGKFMNYLDNYVARLSHSNAMASDDIVNRLPQTGFFTRVRMRENLAGEPVDFATMIEGRIASQAKDKHLNQALRGVADYAKDLPGDWARMVEHYLSRVLNRPSTVDSHVANMLNRIGIFGGDQWTPRRVLDLAQTVNDVTYMGALGFKPFSAARNLFQPLINVPTDLGGMKDYASLTRAFPKAFDKETKDYIRSIGAITDYAPEIAFRPAALPFGKTVKIGGKEMTLPRLQKVRDVSMWMFKGSDRFNRYVTGAAAADKWDRAVAAIGDVSQNNLKSFMKTSGGRGRAEWVQTELEDLILRGKIDEAKALFVKDVIADTQYLYGAVDAPLWTGMHGSVGRTGLIFQTWWMNYINLLDKWVAGEAVDGAANKMFTWMSSQAVAYTIMDALWGENAAKRATFLGPIPSEVNEFLIPPAWTPLYRAMRVGATAAQLNPELSSKEAKRFFESLFVFAPGGLQIKKTAKAGMKEGFEGVSKSIFNLPLSEQ